MSTVILQCSECGKNFEKDKHEVSRRKAKGNSPFWFCSRSCSTSHRNRRTPHTPKPQVGNKYGQKYSRFAWYIKRTAHDQRFKQMLAEDRLVFEKHIEEIWTGICAITGVELQVRDYKGKVGTENRFLIASLDRIDCSVPYQPGNVQWVSHAINQARGNRDLGAFIEDLKVLR